MAMIHVSRSGSTLGVFDEARVREGLSTGEFIGTDLGWTEGMATWLPLSELESFQPSAPQPPPPIAPSFASAAATPITNELVTSPAALPTGERSGLPWDIRESLGFFNALLETIVMVLMKPNDAFRVMKRDDGLMNPVLYVLIMGTVGAIVSIAFSSVMHAVGIGMGNSGMNALASLGFGSFVTLLMMPIMVLLSLFIGAGIGHLCLMLVGGANQSFETTLRVFAYASGSANAFQLIPMCGSVVAGVYGIVLTCIGLARAHETDTWRAVVAVLLPLVVCCGGAAVLVAVLIGSIAGMSGSWH